MNTKKEEILSALSVIIDPDLNQDIVSLGFIHDLIITDTHQVSFEIRLTTPACPVKDMFLESAKDCLKPLSWITKLDIKMGASSPKNSLLKAAKGLENVSSIIAVSSCKGGVGKSSIAVNLAYQLAQNGAKVGIFDADVYGPSLPTMVQTDAGNGLYMEGQWILPMEHEGVKLMSFGYINSPSDGGPALMRGPMVSQIINQLLTGTFWGDLDYLIIDMPPGTGDIPLTLSQLVPLTAAVIVTTPQHISCIDVIKGIQMFDKLKVPVVAVVENMSYFICDGCSKKHMLFGEGALETITRQFGFSNTFKLPLNPELAATCDTGKPFVITHPTDLTASIFNSLAKTVVQEISKRQFLSKSTPEMIYTPNADTITITQFNDVEKRISTVQVRKACRCAHCIDEFSGKNKIDAKTIPADIHPTQIQLVGNYAFGVSWSDGHNSLYPFEQIEKIYNTKI